jgi:hypothetical protein
MNRRIDLWQFFRHLYRGGAYIVLGVIVSGVTWVNAAVKQKNAGVWSTTSHKGERRVALVIGNSKYAPELGKLKNPVNDATDVATALRTLGFEIIGGKAQLDVDLRQMDELVRAFGHEIDGGGVGVFYFSGHGIQVNHVNYLLPLGARIEKEQDVPFEAYNVERILGEMETAENRLNILILDACRNNPLARSFRSGGKGLARPESVPLGTYVAFAARDGQVASDNAEGRNGLFTQELLKNIVRPGLRLEDIFINTRREVRQLSQNSQVPIEYGSIDAPFYFIELNKGIESGALTASPSVPVATDRPSSRPPSPVSPTTGTLLPTGVATTKKGIRFELNGCAMTERREITCHLKLMNTSTSRSVFISLGGDTFLIDSHAGEKLYSLNMSNEDRDERVTGKYSPTALNLFSGQSHNISIRFAASRFFLPSNVYLKEFKLFWSLGKLNASVFNNQSPIRFKDISLGRRQTKGGQIN